MSVNGARFRCLHRRNTMMGSHLLWLTDDHLLLITRFLFMQYISRFYFRDIQALIVQPTWHFMVGLICTGCGLLFIVLRSISGNAGKGILIFGGIVGVLGLINIVLGRTCRLVIITRVQEKKTKIVFRMKKWRKVRPVVIQAIEQEQGPFSIDDCRAFTNAGSSGTPPPPEYHDHTDSTAALQAPPVA